MEEYTNESINEDAGKFENPAPGTVDAEELNDEREDNLGMEMAEAEPEEEEEESFGEGEEEEHPLTLRIKYNGEEKDLTLQEATILAQKGMNYDKVLAERDKLRDSDELRELDYWASQSGMTRETYLQFLKQARGQQIFLDEMAEIRAQYPNLDDTVAKEFAQTRAQIKAAEAKATETKREQERREKDVEPWLEFLKVFPEYAKRDGEIHKDVPSEIFADVENGMRPVEAMLKYQNKNQKLQLEERDNKIIALEKNNKNKAKALTSASGVTDVAKDPFLEGLFC